MPPISVVMLDLPAASASPVYGEEGIQHRCLEYSMLQVTDSAARILRETRAARQLPESFGVRVFFPPSDDGQAALALAFAEEPAEGDQVTEQGGTEIYVAPELAEPLAEHKLDVEDTSEGPRLTLVPPHEST